MTGHCLIILLNPRCLLLETLSRCGDRYRTCLTLWKHKVTSISTAPEHSWVENYSHTTSENIATCRRRHDLTSNNSTSNTSHCLALKNVDGPTGGPRAGATTSLRFPPTFMVLMPCSKPARELNIRCWPPQAPVCNRAPHLHHPST